jgi:hypothetical protein
MKGKRKKEEKEKIIRAEDEWEPIGHTPMPHVTDLRNWDRRLLETYKPFYAPFLRPLLSVHLWKVRPHGDQPRCLRY